jgi:hypothetical protein
MYSSWFDIYGQYVKSYEKMNELLYGYAERLKAINELMVEMVQNFIKFNEQYRELIKTSENAHALHIAYIELLQKFNKQWLEFLWGPAAVKFQIQDK